MEHQRPDDTRDGQDKQGTGPPWTSLDEIEHAWHRIVYGIGTPEDPSKRMSMLHALGGVLTLMEHHRSGVVVGTNRRLGIQVARDPSWVVSRYLAPAIESEVLRVVDPGRGIKQVDWTDPDDDVRPRVLGLRDPDAIDGGRSMAQEREARMHSQSAQLIESRPDGSVLPGDHEGLVPVDSSDLIDQAPWLSIHALSTKARAGRPRARLGFQGLSRDVGLVRVDGVRKHARYLNSKVPRDNLGQTLEPACSDDYRVLAPSPVCYEGWSDAWTEAEAGPAGWLVACSVVGWSEGLGDRPREVTPTGLVKRFGGNRKVWSDRLRVWSERGYAVKVRRGTYRLLFAGLWREGLISGDQAVLALASKIQADHERFSQWRTTRRSWADKQVDSSVAAL